MLKVVGEAAHDAVNGRSLLDEIAREGARRMLVAALETEVAAYLEAHRDERDAEGHALVVRNGKGRTRKVTLGAGTIPVSAPRVNDRRTDRDGERRRFTSRILPPYMRRSPKVAEVLPVLYLRGPSTGDFGEALAALLGDDAAGLSATNIARLTNEWETEYRAFQQRSLADRDYVYVWVDGVHFNVRLEDDRLCTLVMIGVRPDGTKELITVEDGYRESAESWKTVLRDLKRRGMRPPVVAMGDGALGFWAAVRDVWPKTREQRDWFHKLGNILDKLPKRLQPRVKAALHEVMYAETRAQARDAAQRFATEYGAKYPKAVTTLEKDADVLLTFFGLPRRALEASPHVERDRVAVRDGAAARQLGMISARWVRHSPPVSTEISRGRCLTRRWHRGRRRREEDERRRRQEEDARVAAEREAYFALPAEKRLELRLARRLRAFNILEGREPTPTEVDDLRERLAADHRDAPPASSTF